MKLLTDFKSLFAGFGKAVLPMALGLESVLSKHIPRGILSTPKGSMAKFELPKKFTEKYKILEGAQDNLPDADSRNATREIENLVKNLTEDDILFVLISGGGSALLVDPVDKITLEEKQKTIKLLSKNGATIQELNCVRKKLSAVKGGRLAQLSYPNTTVSLILSDVIGDPLDIIASGPTTENNDPERKALEIVEKYGLQNQLSNEVLSALSENVTLETPHFSHVVNEIIGNNQTALQAARDYAQELGYLPLILSDRIQGEASIVGQAFADLAQVVSCMMHQPGSHEHIEQLSVIFEKLNLPPARTCLLEKLVRNSFQNKRNICLVCGGETTVTVRGSGVGGRNQEMALAFALHSAQWQQYGDLEVTFLSAGTDGIDGPTEAAGAIGVATIIEEAICQGLDAQSFLDCNDSFNFYRQLNNGLYHLVTGHTGTNVMDVQILTFCWKVSVNENT